MSDDTPPIGAGSQPVEAQQEGPPARPPRDPDPAMMTSLTAGAVPAEGTGLR